VRTKIIKTNLSEDVMKQVFSILTMVMLLVTLSGCMDDPNMGNHKPKNYGTGAAQDKG
jgi:hypothetical protein